MKLLNSYSKATKSLANINFLLLLLIRLVLAYGFYDTVSVKWEDIKSVGEWFGSLGVPAPLFNAYLVAVIETLGVLLLTLGLGVRFISIPLIISLIVAIKTVHWANGFEAGNNGFEIPLYYILLLMTLFVYGPGKISLDQLVKNKRLKRTVAK